MTKAQEKLLQPPVSSYDADVIRTFKVLALHMPPDSENGHLFLSSIKDARTVVSSCNANLANTMQYLIVLAKV